MEEQSILEAVRDMPHDARILFTTFKFNRYFFEKTIFSSFRKSVLPLVLVDYSEYQLMLREQGSSMLADTRYLIDPIKLSGTFHPKFILAVTDDVVKIIVSSANLTPQGYSTNLEMLTSISLEFSNADAEFLAEVNDFLSELSQYIDSNPHRRQLEFIKDKISEKTAIKMKDSDFKKTEKVHLLHNMKVSILEQVQAIMQPNNGDMISEILVCSPFFSQDPSFYVDFSRSFQNATLAFIIKQNETDIPIHIFRRWKEQLRNLPIFYEILSKRKLHAKFVIFKSKKRLYLLSGSANFTSSALARATAHNGGNIELCVLNVYDYHQEKDSEIMSNLFKKDVRIVRVSLDEIRSETHSFESQQISCFRILEAKIAGNQLIIRLDRKVIDSQVVIKVEKIPRQITVYILNADEIFIELDEKDLLSLTTSSTVQVSIKAGDGSEESSDLKLIYNPQYFPISYAFLNGLIGQDRLNFFRILKSLASLPILKQEEIIPVIDDLVKHDFFHQNPGDAEQAIANSRNLLIQGRIKPNPYSASVQLLNIIKREEYRHEKRLKNAIESRNIGQANIVFVSFYDICKLIILQVNKGLMNVTELRRIRDYVERICLSKQNYLELLLEAGKMSFISEVKLIYHIVCLMHITEFLQTNSTEFQLNYNSLSNRNRVRDVFDETFNDALAKLFKIFPTSRMTRDEITIYLKSYQGEVIDSLPTELEHIQESIARMKERLSTRPDKLNEYCIPFLTFE